MEIIAYENFSHSVIEAIEMTSCRKEGGYRIPTSERGQGEWLNRQSPTRGERGGQNILPDVINVWPLLRNTINVNRAKNTSFWDLIEYQCNMHELEWCQNVPNVCRNLLIYGLYQVFHVSDELLTNYNILVHFWSQKYQFLGPY